MFAWIKKLWPFPWPWKPEDVPEPTHPLLLIPGICGTQLAVRKKTDGKSTDNGSLVWVRVEHADTQYKRLWGRVKPGSDHLDLLDESLEVCVPSKPNDGGLYPVDVLDPSLYLPLHVIYYFHNLIWFLNKHKFVAGKTLFGFGYDFRQSNMAHLDALQKRLEEASAAMNGATVDVITHSMGGLVMRSFLAARPEAYARLVRKWVAIASPFGGAPGFGMDALMTGVQFCQGWEQYFFINRSTMHTMCSQAPAVFELLPDPAVSGVWPEGRPAPTARAVLRSSSPDDGPGSTRTHTFSIAKFRNLLEASLVGFTAQTYDNKTAKLEMSPDCWRISDASREAWRSARLPSGCDFYNIFGTGFSTAYDVEYGSVEEPLDDLTDIATQDPVRNFTDIEGDCTVPVCCATADGFDAIARRGFFATHRGLLELPQVWETVIEWLEDPPKPPAADAATVPSAAAAALALEHSTRRAARQRHSAHLRGQSEARSRAPRAAWSKAAAAMRKRQRTGAADASTASGRGDVGDWVLVDADEVTVHNPLHTSS